MAFWDRFFGSAGSTAAGIAIGATAVPALTPAVKYLENDAWAAFPVVPPDAVILAQGVAQGQVDPQSARDWAAQTGYGQPQFDALVSIANVGPGSAYAFDFWRRGIIGEAAFRRAVKRLGWEQEWIDDAVKVKDLLLTPAELAVMVQRGIVPNDNLLPVGPPTATGKVPPMPMVNVDPITEAAGSGVNQERLAALARIIGLPASPDLAARMVFRGIIDRVDFDRAISEGNTRNEWAPFLFDGFRQIPTAEQFVEGHLRGWLTAAQMYAGTALHGMSQADTDLEFQIHRRPLNPHAITTALARGGKFHPSPGEITDPYEASVHQANLGPEWYELAIANKYSYPSAFVLRALATGGELDEPTTKQTLLEIGWKPDLVDKVVAAWFGATTAGADKHVARAQTQLWTKTHSSYIAEEIDDATATAAIEAAGVAATAVPDVLKLWQQERALIRTQLTPKQIVKALGEGVTNPATGAPWTVADATAALMARGYTQADATVLIQE